MINETRLRDVLRMAMEQVEKRILAAIEPDAQPSKAEPTAPWRTWWVDSVNPQTQYKGTESHLDGLVCTRWNGGVEAQHGAWLPRKQLGTVYLRIPPHLPGMDADECREPKEDEEWYDLDGNLETPVDSGVPIHLLYGRRRWIKKQPPAQETA